VRSVLPRCDDVALPGDHVADREHGRIVRESSDVPVRELEEFAAHRDALLVPLTLIGFTVMPASSRSS
jgi:hypothetical protein